MILFFERGYDAVTIADITTRAGLTKRSFFNHFADKREVVFASADDFEQSTLTALAAADWQTATDPLETAVSAFRTASAPIEEFSELAGARRALIDSSPELQERELVKVASIARSVAKTLSERGVPERDATFIAQAATTVYTTALDEWARDPTLGVTARIDAALADLRTALRVDRTPPPPDVGTVTPLSSPG